MKLLFRSFKAKNWLAILGILLLTIAQVYSMMRVVECIAALTAGMQMKDTGFIWDSGVTLILWAAVMLVAAAVIVVIASWNASEIVTRLRSDVYRRVNDFALADLDAFSTESLITRTTNDMQNLHIALITCFTVIFMVPILVISSISKILSYDLSLTVASGLWILLLIVVIGVLVAVLMPKFNILQKLTDALNIAARENLTGLQVVRAFNAEDYQEAKFEKANQEFTKVNLFTSKAVAFLVPFLMFVLSGISLTVIWVSAYFIDSLQGEAALAAFANTNSFIMLVSQVVMGFVLLITLIVVWPRGMACAKRIDEILSHDVSMDDAENPKEFTEKGTIEFRNVSFMYPGADGNAIEDFSFKVNRGETLAFIGATGSGKTTAVNLIPRMHDATQGEVFVNGVNVKDLSEKKLHGIIGYVPQRKFLFKGTVRENIALSNPDMPLEDVIAAAKVAEADGFIMASDKGMGYDNPVAQGGTNYSGGQKQRLCIARAVAKKAEILIFDDSFSALDYKTDQMVRENISKFDENVTRVIVAARIGTIMDADQILVLDKGKIVGRGKHEDLLRSCDVYREIALTQLSKEELGL